MIRKLRLYSILIVILLGAPAQNSAQIFEAIQPEEGGRNLSVKKVVQDEKGILWIASFNGLFKYHGGKNVIKHEFRDDFIIDYDVTDLLLDDVGNLWVGTDYGLIKYNRIKDKATKYVHNPEDKSSLSNNKIRCLYKDAKGNILVGTKRGGLNIFQPQKNTFQRVVLDSVRTNMPLHIRAIFGENEGTWIGTYNDGLYAAIQIQNPEKPVRNFRKHQKHSITDNKINCIHKFSNDKIIIGTDNGIDVFDKNTKHITNYNIAKVSGVQELNEVNAIHIKSGELWIGTQGGLIKCKSFKDLAAGRMEVYKHYSNTLNSLSFNSVSEIFEDSGGNLWIGTENGLNKYDPIVNQIIMKGGHLENLKLKSIIKYCQYKDGVLMLTQSDGLLLKTEAGIQPFCKALIKKHGLENESFTSVKTDANHTIWLGTSNGYLIQIAPTLSTLKAYKHSVRKSAIYSICRLNETTFLIGTGNEGLKFFDTTTKTFSNDISLPGRITVAKIIKDRKGFIWMATSRGIYKKDLEKDVTVQYLPESSASFSTPNIFNDLKINGNGKLYAGGRNGFYRFDEEHNSFTRIAEHWVTDFDFDAQGNAWLNINNNLFGKLTLADNALQLFEVENGNRDQMFMHRGFFIDSNDHLYLSGFDQLYKFPLVSLNLNSPSTVPNFYALAIAGVEARPGEMFNNQIILDSVIEYTHKITLDYENNDFALFFSNPNYSDIERNKYKYKLHGYDDAWYTDKLGRAHFTNLGAGNYTLEVFCSNGNSEWSQESARLDIKINPPIYLSTLAIAIYLVLTVLIGAIARRIIIARTSLKNELILEKVKQERKEEFNKERIKFYTNISHEFRTPITLILGPIKQLLQKKNITTKDKEELYQLIHSNSTRLLMLVNQLLDFRSSLQKRMKLKVTKFDIAAVVESSLAAFDFMSHEKNIIVDFNKSDDKLEGWLDRDKFEMILFNLFSNAFKHVNPAGNVWVQIAQKAAEETFPMEHVLIEVGNTGKGIPKQHQDKIFERFYRLEENTKSNATGNGIGLALVKNLVELHHGKIILDSDKDKPTSFTILLPFKKENFEENEIFDYNNLGTTLQSMAAIDTVYETDNSTERKKYKLLIIEDNNELRNFLVKYLKNDFITHTAVNGLSGMEVCKKIMPDIIVSDVMMDNQNGLDFCKNLKSDPEISHIPVILMTALASDENILTGYKVGADGYITKPFEPEFLKVTLFNKLNNRKKLKQKYSNNFDVSAKELTISKADEEFLNILESFVEKNIDKADLKVDVLCEEFGMSSSNLYRKVKSITGLSSNEFVSNYRLKKAAKLLIESNLSIKEIAYKVGFSDSRYFSKRFKKQFGTSPGKFIDSNS